MVRRSIVVLQVMYSYKYTEKEKVDAGLQLMEQDTGKV